ncbi:MAG: tetratricopeptide repeat protein, partial [Cyanobacteria bacterium J06632_19]
INVDILAQDENSFENNYLVNIGKALYRSLFPSGKVENAFKAALQLAQNKNTQLHLQLRFEDDSSKRSRLADYPWELIHGWQELDKHAQGLACWLSIFALDPIPWKLVEQCLPEENKEDLEDIRDDFLVDFSLLEDKGENTYQLHQLIREFLISKREEFVDVEDMKRGFCALMAGIGTKIPQIPTQSEIIEITPVIPHIIETATNLKDYLNDEYLIFPFVSLVYFYQGQGNYQKVIPWYEQCLVTSRERFGEEHPSVATSLNNLAYFYKLQGCYEEAELLYKKALQIRTKLFEEENLYVANSLNNLGGLYEIQGRYKEAEPLYEKTLQIRTKLLDEEHPEIATSLNNLAFLYKLQGRYEEAESLYKKALQMRIKLFGEENLYVANILNNLAGLYDSLKCYQKAEDFYTKALQMKKRFLNEEHPDIALSLNNLAVFYYSQGRYQEAETLYKEALSIFENRLGTNHPNTNNIRDNLQYLRDAQNS